MPQPISFKFVVLPLQGTRNHRHTNAASDPPLAISGYRVCYHWFIRLILSALIFRVFLPISVCVCVCVFLHIPPTPTHPLRPFHLLFFLLFFSSLPCALPLPTFVVESLFCCFTCCVVYRIRFCFVFFLLLLFALFCLPPFLVLVYVNVCVCVTPFFGSFKCCFPLLLVCFVMGFACFW